MEHRPFTVLAHLSGPICLRDPLHLDGILLSAREKRFGIEARGRDFPVLARRDGVFQASVGFLVSEGLGGAVEMDTPRVRRIDMKGRDGRNLSFDADSTKAERTVGSMSPFRNTLTSEKVYGNVRMVAWQALGDAAEAEDLLGEIMTIGKQHSTGWGEVERFEVTDSKAAPATCGLCSGERPLRNLPLGLAKTIGVSSGAKFKGRIEPSYASKDGWVDIMGPLLGDLFISEQETREILAY